MTQINENIQLETTMSYETYMKTVRFSHFPQNYIQGVTIYYIAVFIVIALTLFSNVLNDAIALKYIVLTVVVTEALRRSHSMFILPKRIYNSRSINNARRIYLFTPDYIDILTESDIVSASLHILYEAVYKVIITDELIVIYSSLSDAYAINKKENDAQTITAIEERLKSKVKKYTDYNKAPASKKSPI